MAAGASLLFDSTAIRGEIVEVLASSSPPTRPRPSGWRKYGAWYWAITHSLEDFPPPARKMLNRMEWWLRLAMESNEAEQVGPAAGVGAAAS